MVRRNKLKSRIVFAAALLFALLPGLRCIAQVPRKDREQVISPSGASYLLTGANTLRRDNELVLYTADYYRKNPPNAAGVDVYVAGGKVAEVRDRAGAVYIEKKPDPGPVAVGQEGYVLSGNGAARKWLLANLRAGDPVKVATAPAGQTTPTSSEIPPAADLPCFPGAYYRKAVSSLDVWTGIGGIVKLPVPKVDPDRLDEKDKQPLDNFSIYMGGRAGEQEIDAGLSWEFTIDEKGERSKARNAFRPFWRNEKWNSAPAQKQFYWYPGDTVAMAVLVTAPGKLKLYISDATPQPARTFSVEFDARSFQPRVSRQFKRVNAIDQRHNEGRPVQPTRAEAVGAVWQETFLFRGEAAAAQRLSLTPKRMTDMRCPSPAQARVTATEAERARGAESVDIFGTPK